ncbi:MAG: NADH-quinone oxidoreductase subunit N [Candidatus Hydrogenedentota bacterium]
MPEIFVIRPEIIILAIALIILLLDVFIFRQWKGPITFIALVGLIFVGFQLREFFHKIDFYPAFNNNFYLTFYSTYLKILFIISGILSLLSANQYFCLMREFSGVYTSSMLFSLIGMMTLVSSKNLLYIYIGIELMSIPIYIICAYLKESSRCVESGIKYLILGSISAGFILYGISLNYIWTGSLSIDSLNVQTYSGLQLAGILLIIFGVLFKISAFPFHFWTADVYDGAPTPTTAFMSTGVKSAAYGLLALLTYRLISNKNIVYLLSFISIFTMTVGNLSAINQNNIKRLLAFSSIAHSGYILIGLISDNILGGYGMLFYLLFYTFANLGAFTIVGCLENSEDEEYGRSLGAYRGLIYKRPFLAISMAVFLLSLTGIPPFAGFIGKFIIFSAGIKSSLYCTVIIALINSVIAAYYYLRVIVFMFMHKEREEDVPMFYPFLTLSGFLVIIISLFINIYLGILPTKLLNSAYTAYLTIF